MNYTALVTGASRGIGKAIALELAGLGYNLALVGRDSAALGQTAAEAITRGAECLQLPCDLAEVENARKVVDAAVERFGGLDVLVNCAGLSRKGPFTDVSPQEWDRIFAVNAKAPFFLCKAALEPLRKSSRPTVINIASVVSFKGYPGQSVYASSKHALRGFTKVFAKEVQPYGIRVHLISPGGVATEMVREMRPDIDPSELISTDEIAGIVRFILTREGNGTIDEFYIRRYSGLAFD